MVGVCTVVLVLGGNQKPLLPVFVGCVWVFADHVFDVTLGLGGGVAVGGNCLDCGSWWGLVFCCCTSSMLCLWMCPCSPHL